MNAVDVDLRGFADFEEIGRGGFGVVYRARELALDRHVAVKFLPAAAMGESTRKRFERECRAMAALSAHPNIVSLITHGIAEESRRPYIVMEYVAGGSLGRRAPLPWSDAVEAGVALAGALETAHRAGILHRDVKPENVLLSEYGEAKLADFGVAKVQDSSETPTGNITASILHAAPETLIGRRPGPSTDVYSLTSTVYALILGRAPFARTDEETLAPLITRICIEPPPSLLDDGVPPEVDAVLQRGLDKDPQQRFATAAAFAEALQEAQVACGLPPTPYRAIGEPLPEPIANAIADENETNTVVRPRQPVDPDDVTMPRPRLTPDPVEADEPTAPAIRPKAGGATEPGRTMRRRMPLVLAAAAVVLALGTGGTVAAIRTAGHDAPAVLTAPSASATGTSGTATSGGRSKTEAGQPSVGAPAPGGTTADDAGATGGVGTGGSPAGGAGGSASGSGGAAGGGGVGGAVGSTRSRVTSSLPGSSASSTSSTGSRSTTSRTTSTVPTSAPRKQTTGVTLPNFYGWSRDRASAWLAANGLVYPGQYPTTDHSSLPTYAVVRQSIAAGTTVPRGTRVLLTSKDNEYCAQHPGEAAC